MNKDKLFVYLKQQKTSELIKLLDACYDCMKSVDIRHVFGDAESIILKESHDDGEDILKSVQKFMDDSLEGKYYAPFDINSKNCMDVPEETDMWFEKLGELLTESSRLSAQGDHIHAVKCFQILFELMDKLGEEEIVFGDEVGMWMLPIKEEPCIKAYFKSAAAILEPEEYVKSVLPVIHYDSPLFMKKAYKKSIDAANKKQKALLEITIARLNIKTNQKKQQRR